MKFTRGEWIELGLLTAALPAVYLAAPAVEPVALPFGYIVLYCAAVVFGQSLLRDVLKLIAKRRKPGDEGEKRKIACLCAETSMGLLLMVIACGLLLIGISEPVTLAPVGLTVLFAVVTFGSFFAKDFVVIIRREKDHGSVVVW